MIFVGFVIMYSSSAGCNKTQHSDAVPQTQAIAGGTPVTATETPKVKPRPVSPMPEVIAQSPTDFWRLTFSNGESQRMAVLTNDKIEVRVLPSGKVVGTIAISTARSPRIALAPDGKQVAVLADGGYLGSEEITFYTVADGAKTASFKPEYEGKTKPVPGVAHIAYIAADRLLAVSSTGGFDVYDTAKAKRLSGVTGPLKRDEMKWSPRNGANGFSLAENGSSMAIFDGSCFNLYNPLTGKAVGKTDPLNIEQKFGVWGAALRADGSRLAVAIRLGDESTGTDTLRIFDTATGKQVGEKSLKVTFPKDSLLAWCGPDRMLVGGINGNDVEVWTLAGDQPSRQAILGTWIQPATQGGKLWKSDQDPANKSYRLFRIDWPPVEFGPSVRLEFDGYK